VAAIGFPAGAGCCDDLWSCAGAVVSGGLSCAVQAALDDLRSLLRKITDQRDATTTAYNGQLQAIVDDFRAQLAALDAQIKALDKQIEAAQAGGDKILHEDSDLIRASLEIHAAALKITATPAPSAASRLKTTERIPAAAAPAPGPASGATRFATLDTASLKALQSDTSLPTLRQRLDELVREKNKLVAKIVAKESEIMGAEMAAEKAAQDAYASNFLRPIDDVIVSLEAALKDPSKIGGLAIAAANLVADAAKGLEVLFNRALGAVEDTGNAVLVSIVAPVNELEKLAAEATGILAKMEKMTALKTAAERRAFVANAPSSPTPIPSTARKLKSHAGFAGKAQTLATNLAGLRPGVLRLGQPPATVNVAPFRQRLSGEFDGYFRGKSPADAKKKLAELTAEARRRFASDPKTLAAVEKLLNDEARARGVPI
jgi:small-conductance mechanosensitive channel